MLGNVFKDWKTRAKALKTEIYALWIAARDPRTPWFAKALALLVVAYAASPIDLIPDFIPVLGYLDDLILVPLGLLVVIKLIPPEVLAQARETAHQSEGRVSGSVGTVLIVLIWLVGLGLLTMIVIRFFK